MEHDLFGKPVSTRIKSGAGFFRIMLNPRIDRWTWEPPPPTVTSNGRRSGVENASSAKACNALLIYPRFDADTFWNFTRTAEVFGAKYPAPPLGLITLAALLPPSWSLRLVNRNTEELSDDDLDWADLVLTGGMLPQQSDTLDIVDLCRARGKPVVVGGPGVTSSPHLYQTADFRVLGEAEESSTNSSKPGKRARVKGSSRRRNFRST